MRKVLVLASLIALAPISAIAKAADPVGFWSVGEGKSQIQIAPCGEMLCGKIVWLSEPNDNKGRPKLDRNNPDSTLKRQPILGLQILSELKPSADRNDQWEGNVYNPEDGHTYSVYLRPNDTSMEVEGCLAFFCRTQVWPRVPENQQQSLLPTQQQQQN
jgi:uncharacterized protein (DUF2147 family)